MSRLIQLAYRAGRVARDTVNRIGGEPIGMTRDSWPCYREKPMVHVITVGRENIVHPLPERVAAVAVFIQSLRENEAFEPGTGETAVVFLGKDDLARGETSAQAVFGEPPEQETAPAGELVTRESEYAFGEIAKFDDEEEPVPEDEMDEEQIGWAVAEYMAAKRDGELDGAPLGGLSSEHVDWCQSPEAPEGHRVLFYLHDSLVPGLNCGDGFMYVTADPDATEGIAWWQC